VFKVCCKRGLFQYSAMIIEYYIMHDHTDFGALSPLDIIFPHQFVTKYFRPKR
jgi:hypothetical protein